MIDFATHLDSDNWLIPLESSWRGSLRSIPLSRDHAWSDVLRGLAHHDFYHTSDYHQLEAERETDSAAEMIVYSEKSVLVAVPLLFRPIGISEPCSSKTPALSDATSVYGYAGWLASPGVTLDLLRRFGEVLGNYLHARGVVSVFARLHPLKSVQMPEPSVGEISIVGHTIALDTGAGLAAYEAGLASGHRYEIRKLQEKGCTVEREDGNLSEFHRVYTDTMKRIGAKPQYLFSVDFLGRLITSPRVNGRIYVARQDGNIAAMAMFIRCGTIIQYHLSCSQPGVTRYPATKLIVDRAIRDAIEEGTHWMHLGGGVGSREDSLFAFKKGFGGQVLPFKIWRWIVRPGDYEHLCELVHRSTNDPFFPAYRGLES
ncbi:MAG TPA: GNAT family N-acetyltransferase [Opitutaceae bacterium]|nr:GNAT family N-acetyltransferase [Opitutaceae bacterium]